MADNLIQYGRNSGGREWGWDKQENTQLCVFELSYSKGWHCIKDFLEKMGFKEEFEALLLLVVLDLSRKQRIGAELLKAIGYL